MVKILCFAGLTFASAPSHAAYYGEHHYRPYYGHHGYPYHRPYYNYHRGYHHGHHGYYGVSTRVSNGAAYVVLGILGVALLSHIFTNNNKQYEEENYPKSYPYTRPVKVVKKRPVKVQKPIVNKIYRYAKNQGWDSLANGNAEIALDIFAVQSQQTLNSGVPKLGFAIAAATLGEKERAIRAMRKALRTDANALNVIIEDNRKPVVNSLINNYQLDLNINNKNNDTAFMLAALSYLEKDYANATSFLSKNDKSQSANNLRALLKRNTKIY